MSQPDSRRAILAAIPSDRAARRDYMRQHQIWPAHLSTAEFDALLTRVKASSPTWAIGLASIVSAGCDQAHPTMPTPTLEPEAIHG